MAKTASTMLALGTQLPPFALPDFSGKIVDSQSFRGARAIVIMFICNHCPYVIHISSQLGLVTTQMLQERDIVVVAINSNDIEKYPEDRPELMKDFAKSNGFKFPYLFDQSQAIAKSFQAACTPEFYLFNQLQSLVYRGQFDDARPGNHIPPSGVDLLTAFNQTLQNQPVFVDQKPSIGCNIKWRV